MKPTRSSGNRSSFAAQWTCSTQQSPWRRMLLAAAPSGSADLEVTRARGRTIDGFGGCFNEIGQVALAAMPAAKRQAVLESLFGRNGCRFNIGRLPIGASDYALDWYSLNEHAGDFAMRRFSIDRDRRRLIPYIKSALALQPRLRLFASPWSPPTWMKSPAVFNYGTMNWTRRNLEAYALYFVKFVQAYAAAGVQIRHVYPQNEPLADQKFPSCLWTGAQLRDFVRDYMGPAFKRHGLAADIWLGTLNTADYDEYVHGVLRDPRTAKFIAGVGFQWDGKGAIQRCVESYPHLPAWQTENECGDGQNSWDYAMYVWGLARHYIVNGANAFVYWNMVLPPGGRSTWGWKQNSMITVDPATRAVTYNPEFYVVKHMSRYVDPGAATCELRGPWTGNAFAFQNPSGRVVIVLCNPLEEAAKVTVAAAGNSLRCALPPRSFNTIMT